MTLNFFLPALLSASRSGTTTQSPVHRPPPGQEHAFPNEAPDLIERSGDEGQCRFVKVRAADKVLEEVLII